MDAPMILIVALVLTICALVFQIIGLASPYWIYFKSGTIKIYFGLWEKCTELKEMPCEYTADNEGINFEIKQNSRYI